MANEVLLLIPDKNTCLEIKTLLQDLGYNSDCTCNVLDAMKSVKETPRRLIIADIHLDSITGLQFLQMLKAETDHAIQSIPVLFVSHTSVDPELIRSMVIEYGAYEFLPLPCDPIKFRKLALFRLNPALLDPQTREQLEFSNCIMILDDEVAVLQMMKLYLTNHGERVRGYTNYFDFIKDFKQFHPKIVFLDLQLKDRSGLDVLSEIKALNPNVACVMITGFGSEYIAVESFRRGVSDYLIKPFDFDTLPMVIKEAVSKLQNSVLVTQLHQNLVELDQRNQELSDSYEKMNISLRQLSEAKTRLEDLNSFKSYFLAASAHDLRAPLATILAGCINLEHTEEPGLPHEALDTVTLIKASSRRLLITINNLIDIDQVEHGNFTCFYSNMNPAQLISDIAQEMIPYARQRKISIFTNIGSLPPLIRIDREKIERVLFNLILNAIKYNREAGSVTISANRTDQNLVIEIADTGIGIRSEDFPKLFQKYTRLRQKDNLKIESTGLGLFLCSEFIRLHNGHISVSSTPDVGSTFTVTIPIHEVNDFDFS